MALRRPEITIIEATRAVIIRATVTVAERPER
jgi:hypothetical protein